MQRCAAILLALASLGLAAGARADEPVARPRTGAAPAFVLASDPQGPAATEVEALYGLSIGAGASGAVRLVDPTLGRQGVVQQLGVVAAPTDWIALGAYGLLSAAGPSGEPIAGTGGGSVQLTAARPDPETGEGGSAGVLLGVHREFEGTIAATATLLGGWTWGRVETAANVLLERRFASDADPLDVIVRMAIAYAVVPDVHLGVEYVGQDLEDAVEDEEAEGGAVHVVAASGSVRLLEGDLDLGVAPGVGISASGVAFVGRFVASYRF